MSKDLQLEVGALSEKLQGLGLPEMVLVRPEDCLPQDKNARYFEANVFEQLVDNIKSDGHLESVPLLFQDEDLKKKGKYQIISGHHRVDAAKKAGLEYIMAFVKRDLTRQEIVSKQLAHNSLTGLDDMTILSELYSSIEDVNLRLASGLSDEIEKIQYESLNFKAGTFEDLLFIFAPDEIDDIDKAMDELEKASPSTKVRVADKEDHAALLDALMTIKKVKNVKSNSVAMKLLISLATDKLKELQSQANKDE